MIVVLDRICCAYVVLDIFRILHLAHQNFQKNRIVTRFPLTFYLQTSVWNQQKRRWSTLSKSIKQMTGEVAEQ